LYGWTGKILHVNLSKEKISTKMLDKEIYQKYLGGTGFGFK